MRKGVLIFVLVSQIILLSTCMRQRAQFKMPQQIAILPTINHTTDVAGGLVFRYLLYEALNDRYPAKFVAVEMVDTLLNEEGITDGGQLNAVENEELFKILAADGLLFIELTACDYKTLGISETRRVSARFLLVGTHADTLWRFEHEVDEGKSVFDTFFQALDDPKEAFKNSAEDLGEQLAAKGAKMWILDHPLKPEMEAVIEETLDSLP
jgi:hypothetical protein